MPQIRTFIARCTSLLALAASLSGCSTLSPHIFSDRLLERGGTSDVAAGASGRPLTLEEAYADAAQVQRRYVTAIQDQGNAVPQLAAAGLVATAATLIGGINGVDSKDLARLGVAVATGWAYSNTFLSKSRLDVYRSGAEAMGCAMAAVEPLRQGAQTLGAPGDRAGTPTLYGLRAEVNVRREQLRSLLLQHASLKKDKTTDYPAGTECKEVTIAPKCPSPPANASTEQKLRHAQCISQPRQKKQQCTKTEAHSETIPANKAAVAAFNEAERQLQLADQQLASTARIARTIEEAGALLWKKSVEIQLAVSAEVDKTVPNVASVLAAAGGMREVGLYVSGGFQPPGGAQGNITQELKLTPEERNTLRQIEQATSELRDARAQLDSLASASLGYSRTELRKTINECAVKATGIKLSVNPSSDAVSVPAGGTIRFFVSGGTGVPTASVVKGPKTTGLQLKVEAGLIVWEFTVPSDVPEGSSYTLRFADSSGSVEKFVEVHVAEAGAGNGSGGGTGGAGASSPFANMTPDERRLLKLPASPTDAQIQHAIDRCQATATNPAIEKTGKFDAATKERLKAGTCDPTG